MQRIKPLSFIISITMLISCQKETDFGTAQAGGGSGGTNNSIIGTWRFIEMEAKTESTTTLSAPFLGTLKTVAKSEYKTIQNGGTMKIEATKMTGIDFTYSINTTVKGYVYEDNVLTDSIEAPLSFTLPPTNSTATYKKIGTDSIHIETGNFIQIQGSGPVQSKPGGFRIKVEGDKLILTTIFSENKANNSGGINETQNMHATLKSSYQRQ